MHKQPKARPLTTDEQRRYWMCFDANGVVAWEIAPVLETDEQPDRLTVDDIRVLL